MQRQAKTRHNFEKSVLISGALAAALFCVAPQTFSATHEIVWKPISDAILKISGRKPPKNWSVYQDAKKKSRVLVQMDNRLLVIDAKTKQIFDIPPSDLQPHKKNFETPDPSGAHAIPSTGWDMRDIGPAERIQVELVRENVSLDIELPHPLNLHTAY